MGHVESVFVRDGVFLLKTFLQIWGQGLPQNIKLTESTTTKITLLKIADGSLLEKIAVIEETLGFLHLTIKLSQPMNGKDELAFAKLPLEGALIEDGLLKTRSHRLLLGLLFLSAKRFIRIMPSNFISQRVS